MDPIRFYTTHGEFGCFSNFSRHRIIIGGLLFPTTEHYFHWDKWVAWNSPLAERIRKARGPMEAKRLAHSKRFTPAHRNAWDSQKDSVMRAALRAKFAQHRSCRTTLLSTGDAVIIEAAPEDYYWGEGADRTGKNMLGKLLMELRRELRLAYPHENRT